LSQLREEGQPGRPKRARMAAPLHGLGREFLATGARMLRKQQTCKWIDDREVSHEYANRDLSDSIQSCVRLSGRAASHFLSGGPGYIRSVRFSHIQSRQGQPPRL